MIISERGAQFVAHFWEHLQASLGTKLIRSLELVSSIMTKVGTDAYL
jgi:hypothetical protein